MDKVEKREVMQEKRIHIITCDRCGEEICQVEESEGVFYTNPASYEQSMFIRRTGTSILDGTWWKFDADLCECCAILQTRAIKTALDALGFKEVV